MKSSRKKLIGLTILLLFLVPLGVAGKKVYRELRQPELNRALIAAVKRNDTAAVVALLSEGADSNARDIPPDKRSMRLRLWDCLCGKRLPISHVRTALLVALTTNAKSDYMPENVPLVNALLTKGAEVNVCQEDGMTPLMLAAWASKRETVRLLLKKGPAINAKDKDGGTALHYSCVFGSDPSIVRMLVVQGALIDARNNSGETPLHIAANTGQVVTASLLLLCGADVNALDTSGDTPLCLASKNDQTTIVELLLTKGAQVNTKDTGDETPLTLAQSNHFFQIVKMLKKAGAKE